MARTVDLARRLARRIRRAPVAAAPWEQSGPQPWAPDPVGPPGAVRCNICRWTGDRFSGPAHSEGAVCPRCGSIARDRFLLWCFVARNPDRTGARLLETSPRLGAPYRAAMRQWFDYLCSDFDDRGHRGEVHLDLQSVELADASVDVILTPHVLEHVPDTDRALGELHRVLVPGGTAYIQVPVLQGATAPPGTPEFHADDTPVHWRFGPDLVRRLRDAGFDAALLCTGPFADGVRSGADAVTWPEPARSPEFDLASILAGVDADDLVAVADASESARRGFAPSFMFLTFEARRPER